MKSTMKSLVLGSVMTSSLLAGGVAMADSPLTANIGVTSNYIWRGMTQTGDLSAVSGGIDYAHDSGAYAGTWTSNLGGGDYEWDLYAGYGFDAGPVGLDLGLIDYRYPVSASDFREAYVNASFKMLTAGVAYTFGSDDDTTPYFSKGDLYYSVGASFDVAKDMAAGITVGRYNFDDAAAEDYTHYQLSLSKDDFTFALDKNNATGPADKMRISASWSKSFDL